MSETVGRLRAVGRYVFCVFFIGFGVSLLLSDDATPDGRYGLTDRQGGLLLVVLGVLLLVHTAVTDRKK